MDMIEALESYMQLKKVSRNKLSDLSGVDKYRVYRVFSRKSEATTSEIERFLAAMGLDFVFFIKR